MAKATQQNATVVAEQQKAADEETARQAAEQQKAADEEAARQAAEQQKAADEEAARQAVEQQKAADEETARQAADDTERRRFVIISRVRLDNEMYPVGAPVRLTRSEHFKLAKAGAVDPDWDEDED